MSETMNKRGVYVGLFILIGLIFLIGGVLTIGNLRSTFQKKIKVTTIFDNVDGLHAGSNIWFSGVKIGTIKKIEFYGESQVKVVMNINAESRQYIRKDSKVKLSTDGLIGNKILVIYGGTSDVAEIEEGDMLANEKQLSTDDIMDVFQQNNLNILALTEKLTAGEGTIGKLINDETIYNNMLATSRSLDAATARAEVLIGSLAQFSAKLNTSGTLVNDLVTDTVLFITMKNSVLQLKSIMDTVNIFVSNLKEAGKNPDSPLGILIYDEAAGASLKSTILNLESSSIKLDANLEALKHSFLLKKYYRKEARKNKNE